MRPSTKGRRVTQRPIRLSLLALALLVAACTGGGPEKATPDASSADDVPPTQTYLGVRVELVPPARVEVLDVPVNGFLAASTDPDRIWVGGADGLAWLDPVRRSSVLVDRKRGVGLTISGHRLYRAAWAGNDVSRYEISGAGTREVTRAPVPSPLYVAVGAAGVWAADHDHGRLLRLDPDTLKITARVTIGSGEGLGTAGMVWVGEHLWAVSKRDNSLYELDGRTGRTITRVDLGGYPGDDITLTPAGIWTEVDLASNDRPVYCLVDTQRHRIVARVNVRPPANTTQDNAWMISAPVFVGDQVWVPVDRYLIHLDSNGHWRPDRVLELPTPITARFAVAAFGSLWISSPYPRPFTIRVDGAALT